MNWRVFKGVDVRVWRRNGFIVARSVDDGDDISIEQIEKFFGYVIAAERIFEREVELVIDLDPLVAIVQLIE